MLKQVTEWDTNLKLWMVGEESLFSPLFKPFSGRWPIWGMMRDGVVFELPMPVRHTTGSECSSSPTLPTPNTMEHREVKTPEQIAELKERSPGGYRNLREVVINEIDDLQLFGTPRTSSANASTEKQVEAGAPKSRIEDQVQLLSTPVASEGTKASATQSSFERAKTGQVFLTNQIHDLAVENGLLVPERLLPTPMSSDSKGTGPADENRVTVQLRAINHLLPTVTTQESKSGPSQMNRNTPPLNAILPELHNQGVSWGKFESAIRRWEQVINRPAPAPTKPDGKDGAHRLSSEFTEWMMGLPAGWITEVGLKRNDELKACGNGVVPQQAELALRMLLEGVEIK